MSTRTEIISASAQEARRMYDIGAALYEAGGSYRIVISYQQRAAALYEAVRFMRDNTNEYAHNHEARMFEILDPEAAEWCARHYNQEREAFKQMHGVYPGWGWKSKYDVSY